MEEITFNLRNKQEFAEKLVAIGRRVGFKISARGWCYQLEGFRIINKDEFDRVERAINFCRKKGYLPVDFVAEEEARQFSGIEAPDSDTPIEYMRSFLQATLDCQDWYTPDWWEGEDYYIQMVVEKIDLKTLFEPVCQEYHIPIATSKGWSSILQRARYARRFKWAEQDGLKCVLLYAGDFDPDGGRISDFLRSNLKDLENISWETGQTGYDPTDLIIDRFGLNYDFIIENDLTWIENLITGSKKDLADPSHKNHHMAYVQEYLKKYGVRKCEANALVVRPEQGRELCRQAIEKYVGDGALDRFEQKRQAIRDEMAEFREKVGLDTAVEDALELIDEELAEEEEV